MGSRTDAGVDRVAQLRVAAGRLRLDGGQRLQHQLLHGARVAGRWRGRGAAAGWRRLTTGGQARTVRVGSRGPRASGRRRVPARCLHRAASAWGRQVRSGGLRGVEAPSQRGKCVFRPRTLFRRRTGTEPHGVPCQCAYVSLIVTLVERRTPLRLVTPRLGLAAPTGISGPAAAWLKVFHASSLPPLERLLCPCLTVTGRGRPMRVSHCSAHPYTHRLPPAHRPNDGCGAGDTPLSPLPAARCPLPSPATPPPPAARGRRHTGSPRCWRCSTGSTPGRRRTSRWWCGTCWQCPPRWPRAWP